MTTWLRLWVDLIVALALPLVLYTVRPMWGYLSLVPCGVAALVLTVVMWRRFNGSS